MIGTAAIIKGAIFISNRLASWFGSGYYVKKGIKHKKKRFYVVAVVISVLMFWLLWLVLGHR